MGARLRGSDSAVFAFLPASSGNGTTASRQPPLRLIIPELLEDWGQAVVIDNCASAIGMRS